MADPKDMDEYLARFAKNQRVEGYGIDGVVIHVPCPFCAAPDIIVHKILEVEAAYSKGGVCKECERGFRARFDRQTDGASASIRFGFVQTCGPDAPPWVAEAIPRDVPRETETP